MGSVQKLQQGGQIAYLFTDVCEPIKFSIQSCEGLRLIWLEAELEQLEKELREEERNRRELLYALFLSRCIAHLKRRIRTLKGEPLFDKPAVKKIKNQRRGSK